MIEILISTMNQKNYELIDKMNIKSHAIVINQTKNKLKNSIKNKNIKWVDIDEKGLSKSRNKALSLSTKDILVIADDDLIYVDNYINIIEEAFKKNNEADVIVFQVEGINQPFKNYSSKEKRINYLSSMKVSSVEIAFRRDSVLKNAISFNENFGSGAKYIMGEENLFLFDCLKKGLTIYYVPVKIADLFIGNSSWFKGYNDKYFISRGANYAAMSKYISLLLIIQFSIRKFKLYKNEMSFIKSVSFMLRGRKEYLRKERINEKK